MVWNFISFIDPGCIDIVLEHAFLFFSSHDLTLNIEYLTLVVISYEIYEKSRRLSYQMTTKASFINFIY